jgi:hypothetical protein
MGEAPASASAGEQRVRSHRLSARAARFATASPSLAPYTVAPTRAGGRRGMAHGALAGFHAARWPPFCLSPARGIHRAGHDAAMAGARGRHGAVRAEAVLVGRPGTSRRSVLQRVESASKYLRGAIRVLTTHSRLEHSRRAPSCVSLAPVGHAWSTRRVRVGVRVDCAWGTRGVRVEHRYILKDIDRSFPAHAAFASLAPPSLIPSLWRVRPSLPGSVPSVPNPPRRLQLLSLPAPPSRSHASPLCPCRCRCRCHRSLRSNAQLRGFVGLLPVSCGRRRVY